MAIFAIHEVTRVLAEAVGLDLAEVIEFTISCSLGDIPRVVATHAIFNVAEGCFENVTRSYHLVEDD